MNANVIYGVCNGDSGGYTSASNYSSDMSGPVVYGYGSGSVNGGGGGSVNGGSVNGGSAQATTPGDSGPIGAVGTPSHYLLASTQHSLVSQSGVGGDPRTPPLTPHDQQNMTTPDNGLSYTNLDANGYATTGTYHHHAMVQAPSQHLPVSSVSVGSANNSAVNTNPYHTDYSHHGGSHQSNLLQQHSHSNPLHSHPHGIQHHQAHHHGHPALSAHGDATNGLSGVAIPGATPGYGYPDVTQYGARTHAMSLGAAASGFPYAGHSVVSGVLRDQCQVNGMLSLAGLATANHPAHQNPNLNPHAAQQQPNVPTYKWMQVKRNVPKPGQSQSQLLYIRLVTTHIFIISLSFPSFNLRKSLLEILLLL